MTPRGPENDIRTAAGRRHATAGRGNCCLVATHSEEFLALADRVLTISDGRLPARLATGH